MRILEIGLKEKLPHIDNILAEQGLFFARETNKSDRTRVYEWFDGGEKPKVINVTYTDKVDLEVYGPLLKNGSVDAVVEITTWANRTKSVSDKQFAIAQYFLENFDTVTDEDTRSEFEHHYFRGL